MLDSAKMDWQSTDTTTTNTEQMRQTQPKQIMGVDFVVIWATRESGGVHNSKRRHMSALPSRSLARLSETCCSGRVTRTKKVAQCVACQKDFSFIAATPSDGYRSTQLLVKFLTVTSSVTAQTVDGMAQVSRGPWLGYFAVDSLDLVGWLVAQL